MKNLFLIILLVLTGFSQVIIYRQSLISGDSNGAPVLYWVTDPNPARVEQIRFFRSWLKKNGYPDIDLKTDSANQNKVLIQGVTGVGGDVFDASSASIPYYRTVGMLDDVTEDMRSFGVTEENCYKSILGDLFYEGRQFAYPCNAGANHYIVNIDTLKKFGMERPPEVNTFDAFEKLGQEFVTRANPNGKRLRFFASPPPMDALTRSVGVSSFNETLTASAVNRPEYADILRRMRKWTYEYHIIPTKADMDSISVEQGYGGSYPQLFANGNMVMIYFARYILIQIRAMNKAPEMSGMLAPHGGYPNAVAFTRAAVRYKGGHHRDLAKYFMGFLASEDYNMQIVRDSDGLPPNPIYTKREEFLRPVGRTNEWLAHQFSLKAMEEYGIGSEVSPFLLAANYGREVRKVEEGFNSLIYSPEETIQRIEKIANQQIKAFVSRDSDVKERYQKALAKQKEIDGYKAAGKKIPLRLVDNVFLKRYYKDTGKGE